MKQCWNEPIPLLFSSIIRRKHDQQIKYLNKKRNAVSLSFVLVDTDLPEWHAVFHQVFPILLLHKNMLQEQLHHDHTTPHTSENTEKNIYHDHTTPHTSENTVKNIHLSATNKNWWTLLDIVLYKKGKTWNFVYSTWMPSHIHGGIRIGLHVCPPSVFLSLSFVAQIHVSMRASSHANKYINSELYGPITFISWATHDTNFRLWTASQENFFI